VVFVSGEPGIGKTTLVRVFLDSLARDGAARIGRGQCIEQYGSGEPYMPVLEALIRLCQEPEGANLLELLRRIAPTWVAQMPSLLTAEERARLPGETQGATRPRMLREMVAANGGQHEYEGDPLLLRGRLAAKPQAHRGGQWRGVFQRRLRRQDAVVWQPCVSTARCQCDAL
jgi:hypothetical protein